MPLFQGWGAFEVAIRDIEDRIFGIAWTVFQRQVVSEKASCRALKKVLNPTSLVYVDHNYGCKGFGVSR